MNNFASKPLLLLYTFLLLAADLIALYLSFVLVAYVQDISLNVKEYLWIFAFLLLTLSAQKIYSVRYDFWGDAKRVLKGFFFSFFVVFTTLLLADVFEEYSVDFLSYFFVTAAFVTLFLKRVFKKILFSFDALKLRVKIVADEQEYMIFCNELEKNWYFGYKIDPQEYDLVILSSRGFELDVLKDRVREFSHTTKDIFIVPYLSYLDFSNTTVVDFSNIRFSAIHIENRLLSGKNILMKYLFEKIVVLALFPFALLMHFLIRFLIKRDSAGDVFFIQQRLGVDAKPFACYKYRTMYEKNEDLLETYLARHPEEREYYAKYHKYENDPRITKIGKFLRKTSLDELPQFFNILKGDMNLIGPRPYMPCERDAMGEENQEFILQVKPGLTGLWQVSGRNELTFKQRVELDVWYIQNWSLWIDFVIFLKTLKAVLLKVGAK